MERYQFTWPDKKKSVVLANQPINKTLRLDREKSVGRDGTPGSIDSENIYIEGDNLDALKLLQETYLGKVKMIYIDPPYNTGNDFIYEDDFSQDTDFYMDNSGQIDDEGNRLVQNTESNGRYHTDWLNMIYPRLRIAKDLLSMDGIIYISIDDNEQENLRKVCDEIFGEENRINTITLNMSNMSGPKVTHAISGKRFPKIKEYLLLYCKDKNSYKLDIPKEQKESWDPEYNLIIPEFKITDLSLFNGQDSEKIKNRIKNLTICSLKEYLKENNVDDSLEWKMDNAYRIFASKPNVAILNKARELSFDSPLAVISNSSGNLKFIKTDFNRNTKTARIELVNAYINSASYLGDHWPDIVTTGGIGQEGGVPFQNGKKPLKLLKRISKSLDTKDSIVMDFFSGSATTAHAIMQLNAEDGGNRKFIMVQIPEKCPLGSESGKAGYKTICDIGEERIRRAGKKIKEEHPEANVDIGFRVFKVDSSNMKDVYYKPDGYDQGQIDLFTDNIKEDRTPEDLLFQVMLDLGISLSSKIEESVINDKKVFVVGGEYTTLDGSSRTHLIACFDKDITDDTVKAIAEKHPSYAVFRDSCMANDSVATNFEQIFETYSPDTVRKVL